MTWLEGCPPLPGYKYSMLFAPGRATQRRHLCLYVSEEGPVAAAGERPSGMFARDWARRGATCTSEVLAQGFLYLTARPAASPPAAWAESTVRATSFP